MIWYSTVEYGIVWYGSRLQQVGIWTCTLYAGFPSSLGFEVGGQSYSNLLASTAYIGILSPERPRKDLRAPLKELKVRIWSIEGRSRVCMLIGVKWLFLVSFKRGSGHLFGVDIRQVWR